MRTDTMIVPYMAAFMFATNSEIPVRIPKSDRRYNVANRQEQHIFKIDKQAVKNELQTFAEFLLAHKADQDLANTVLETEERKNMQARSTSSVREVCDDIKNGNFENLWMDRPSKILLQGTRSINSEIEIAHQYSLLIRNHAQSILKGELKTKLVREELMIIMQYLVASALRNTKTVKTFTSWLRHNGIILKDIRKDGEKCKGIEVIWKVSSELQAELLKTYKQSERNKK
jgi:hypothetical protein